MRLDAVFVEGHTDSDGSAAYNWQLSAARAINTFVALEEQGARALGLRNTQGQFLFSVAGYGENRPVTIERTDADKQQNRRIDLRFVMQVSHAEALERVRSMLVEAVE
jgi:outer membrane protein OmpA-like peptidoglycan-associated protein